MLRRKNVWYRPSEMIGQGMAFAAEYLPFEDRGNPESYHTSYNGLDRCCRCSRVTGTARLVSFSQDKYVIEAGMCQSDVSNHGR